jgi:NADPH-dependent 2,4-dienoyl-CoA reductase/sulfur reductase-like enzyme
MKPTVVVVGASVAGVRAAQALRREGFEGFIRLLDGQTGYPYDKPMLSKDFLQAPSELPPTPLIDAAELVRADIDYLEAVTARAVDPRARTVETTAGTVRFDDLIVATGSAPRPLPRTIPAAAEGVRALRTLDDARAIRAAVASRPAVVIIGGGFIGAEVASSLRLLGLDVTVVEATPTLLSRVLPPEPATVAQNLHTDAGVDIRVGTSVTAIRGGHSVEAVELSDGSTIDAQLVIVAIGTVPSTDWLQSSGLRLGDGLVCDEYLRAEGADHVWAVGDVARWPNPWGSESVRYEHWTGAREQAVTVARSIATGSPEVCRVVPYVWSHQQGLMIQHVGSTTSDSIERTRHDDGSELFVYQQFGRTVGATGFGVPGAIARIRRDLQKSMVETASAKGLL